MEPGLTATRVGGDAWGAWNRFLAGHPDAGAHQSSWWAALHRGNGGGSFGVMVRRNGIVLGGAVVVRESLAPDLACYRIIDGPVLPTDPDEAEEVLRNLLSTLQRRRVREPVVISHLRLEPRWGELPDFIRGLRPMLIGLRRPLTTIDLTVSETAILAQMAPATRGMIALARQLGLTIVEDSSDRGIAALVRIAEAAGIRATGIDSPDTEVILPLLRLHGRGGIFFAMDGDLPIAAAAVLVFGARATLIVAATVDGAQEAPAPTFLQFEMMRRMRGRHCALYDLGDFAGRGVHFDGLGGERRGLIPPVDLVLDPGAYAAVPRHDPA